MRHPEPPDAVVVGAAEALVLVGREPAARTGDDEGQVREREDAETGRRAPSGSPSVSGGRTLDRKRYEEQDRKELERRADPEGDPGPDRPPSPPQPESGHGGRDDEQLPIHEGVERERGGRGPQERPPPGHPR